MRKGGRVAQLDALGLRGFKGGGSKEGFKGGGFKGGGFKGGL